MGNYLDDLIGYKTVRALGSAPVPQRAALSFEGAGVSLADNPLLEQTEVTLQTIGAIVAVDFEAVLDDYEVSPQVITHAQLASADLVRIQAFGEDVQPIVGLDVTGVTVVRKTLVNLGPAALSLVHASTDAPAACRFRLPAGSDIPVLVDQSLDVVYVPASTGVTAGWRVAL
jgi:hypothetical protein